MSKRDQIAQLELQLVNERKFRHEIEQIQRIIAVALRALALRMLTAAVLVADCVLFAWALAIGSWQALTTAVLFAVATWCVLHLRPPTKEKASEKGDVPP